MSYKYPLNPQKLLKIKDMATALEYGSVKMDKRIQVVMPKIIVETLDSMFPNVDRSKVLTQLVINAILQQHRYSDRPDLGVIQNSEQAQLNTMFNYLENREKDNEPS